MSVSIQNRLSELMKLAWQFVHSPLQKTTAREPNDTIQVYYDTESMEFRSFKKANIKL